MTLFIVETFKPFGKIGWATLIVPIAFVTLINKLQFSKMSIDHHKILSELKEASSETGGINFTETYTGSAKPSYKIRNPILRQIAKSWLVEEPKKSAEDVLALVEELYAGQSHEEKKLASFLVGYRKDLRAIVTFQHLHRWLEQLEGWAEIDSLCQNNFLAKELLDRWPDWCQFLLELAKSPSVTKRRAALVFLVGPTRKEADTGLHDVAYANIERLKAEKDILIAKAVSWLLRSMANSDKAGVQAYLESNATTLPAIAVRETKTFLKQGKKT